jgi:hypothetical protein
MEIKAIASQTVQDVSAEHVEEAVHDSVDKNNIIVLQ